MSVGDPPVMWNALVLMPHTNPVDRLGSEPRGCVFPGGLLVCRPGTLVPLVPYLQAVQHGQLVLSSDVAPQKDRQADAVIVVGLPVRHRPGRWGWGWEWGYCRWEYCGE